MKKEAHDLVVQVPDYGAGNPYLQNLGDSLTTLGWQVKYSGFPKARFPIFALKRQYPDTKVIHIHWLTELIDRAQWSQSKLKTHLKGFMIYCECKLLSLLGTKVVWTIHNKLAHEQHNSELEIIYRRWFAKAVDKIVIHSQPAIDVVSELYNYKIEPKTQVVFHGNYAGNYPPVSITSSDFRELLGVPRDATVFAYVGMIKPYKGVENLINAFKKLEDPNKFLIIVGKVSDTEYQKKLEALLSKTKHCFFEFIFIEDQKLINLLNCADFVCLPFADTLTSGSTILAMTQGKALILPTSARVFGCVPEGGVYYFEDHIQLEDIMKNANVKTATEMGLLNQQAATEMNWVKVGQMLKVVYTA
jgi:beta-1,4-mannosyltransferase